MKKKTPTEAWNMGREAYWGDPVDGLKCNPFPMSSRNAREFENGFENEEDLSLR